LPTIGWRGVFVNLAILTFVCILLIIIFIPKWNISSLDKGEQNKKLSEIWKNDFFKSLVPMGLFNYGGLFAIQTLWAGPWMVRVSGYTAEESAQGLFMIYCSMLLSFLLWGYFVPKISKNVKDAIRLLKLGVPLSLVTLVFIIYLGPEAGSIHWSLFVVTSIFLSLSQPAVGMAFSLSNAGKALTSFNLLLFVGAFFVQWAIGLIIDFSINLNFSEINAFRFSMMFVLITSFISYLYFLIKNS